MERQRGIALLMVLWALVLLALLATVFGGNARTEVLLARNLVENAQAEALADAGIYRAIAGLTKEPREGGFHGDGRVYTWHAGGGEVRFSVRDEGGKIDLNQASDILLRELFVAVGVDPKRSAELADATSTSATRTATSGRTAPRSTITSRRVCPMGRRTGRSSSPTN